MHIATKLMPSRYGRPRYECQCRETERVWHTLRGRLITPTKFFPKAVAKETIRRCFSFAFAPYVGKKSLAPERLPCTALCVNAEIYARYIRSSKVLRSIFDLDAYHTSCETLAYLSGSFSRKMSSTSALSNGLLTQSTVYHGMWIKWSQGFVRGATLTTTTTGGAILVALLALFIQFTGSHLWEILRFTVH